MWTILNRWHQHGPQITPRRVVRNAFFPARRQIRWYIHPEPRPVCQLWVTEQSHPIFPNVLRVYYHQEVHFPELHARLRVQVHFRLRVRHLVVHEGWHHVDPMRWQQDLGDADKYIFVSIKVDIILNYNVCLWFWNVAENRGWVCFMFRFHPPSIITIIIHHGIRISILCSARWWDVIDIECM